MTEYHFQVGLAGSNQRNPDFLNPYLLDMVTK